AQAETAFAKIVALAPDQALGYANLGLVHLRLGRYDVAEREIRRAAALDTASDDIALTLAKVYELTGRTSEARREVGRGPRRTPWVSDPHVQPCHHTAGTGCAHHRRGDPLQRRDERRRAGWRVAARRHRPRRGARDR